MANANVIADVKSKIIVSCRHFFAEMIFSATSKVQNYQNKSRENSLYPNKWSLHISRIFKHFQIYLLYPLSLANCKQLRKHNCLYWLSLSPMFFSINIRDPISLGSICSYNDITSIPRHYCCISYRISMSKMLISCNIFCSPCHLLIPLCIFVRKYFQIRSLKSFRKYKPEI